MKHTVNIGMDKPIPQEILDRLEFEDRDGERKVKRVEPASNICEDCGLTIQCERRINLYVNYRGGVAPHVKRKCTVCKNYQNPVTGAWDCDSPAITSHYQLRKKAKR